MKPHSGFQRDYIAHHMTFDDPDEFRRPIPPGASVADIAPVGTIVETSYDTGPYVVLRVSQHDYNPQNFPFKPCPTWSFAMCKLDEPTKVAEYYINEVVPQNGRLLMLFSANTDEVFVRGMAPADVIIKCGLGQPTLF